MRDFGVEHRSTDWSDVHDVTPGKAIVSAHRELSLIPDWLFHSFKFRIV
jgi:hypothetical protein